MEENDALTELWDTLLEFEVDFIMISNFIIENPNVSDVLQDFDILIKNNSENFKRFVKALITCGKENFISPPTDTKPAEFTTIQLSDSIDLDIYTLLPGYEHIPFEQLLLISQPIHAWRGNVLILKKEIVDINLA
jgi:hypothetical protein